MSDSSEFPANAKTFAQKRKLAKGVGTQSSTILFVSSDDLLRARTRSFLESEDLRVFSSADAECVSEVVFCAHDVNVLVIDEDSLGLRGLELASEFCANRPWVSVIVLTGDFTLPGVIRTVHLHGWKLLRKPLHLIILLGVIRQALDHKERRFARANSRNFRRTAEIIPFPPPLSHLGPPEPPFRERHSLRLLPGEEEA